jgi:hypothetical protein
MLSILFWKVMIDLRAIILKNIMLEFNIFFISSVLFQHI